MVQSIFFELGIVIAIATLISAIVKFIKQPLIIGYIITGVIIGPVALDLAHSSDTLVAFSQLGVALLLFIVGLNLNFKTLKEVGFVSLAIAIGQVLFTFVIGYVISTLLGFSGTSSLYISTALTFSSTIIIVKLLSDKHDLDSLYGKIAVGILLVQDFIAVLILMLLSSELKSELIGGMIAFTLAKVVGIIIALLLVSSYVLPRILNFVAKSQELLFLFGISWLFALSIALNKIGFSIEIGALFAGISLASSPFHFEIGSRLRPLRDFFIILFFISLGSQMIFKAANVIIAIAVFSAFVLVSKPLIVMFIMGMMGYKKRVGFSTGIATAQISEFSLILLFLGMNLGHLSQEIVSSVTVVGMITMAGSTYMIMHSDRLYRSLSRHLSIFEIRKLKTGYDNTKHDNFKIVLFGYNRIGYSLLKSFKKLKKKFLIVDYNPEIINMLERQSVPYRYGDASDSELLEELDFHNVELAISTIPSLDTNLLLIEKIRVINKKTIVVMTSHQIDEAFRLYEAGADYVILPHFLGGEHASALIEKFGTNIAKFVKEKIRHIQELNHRKGFGHEHPQHYSK
ncbi:cation:proton antiporter [Candidatus Woesearchaeota archaeon]|nr:cation:proton antiporter [Candidatus Woesearchaeota archaeon]